MVRAGSWDPAGRGLTGPELWAQKQLAKPALPPTPVLD